MDAHVKEMGEAKKNVLSRGFRVGTLVHTKEGLKRIEHIEVGDYVLSQPDNQGEPSYKRVVNTLRYENKALWRLTYYSQTDLDTAKAENRLVSFSETKKVYLTGNHTVWVKDYGWKQASDFDEGEEFELADGTEALIIDCYPVYKTNNGNNVWIHTFITNETGELLTLDQLDIEECYEVPYRYDTPSDIEIGDESCYYMEEVFNIEVEEYNTYFVGAHGVWVHA